MDGGGRGGSDDGGFAVFERDLRPGGGGKDMMNACLEEFGLNMRRTVLVR